MFKKKKLRLISFLATAFVALAGLAVGFTQMTTNASAQGGNVFEMENGTSLKISDDGGIRFRVKMDEAQARYIIDNDEVTLHFLMAPHEFYNAVPLEDGTRDYYNGLSKKVVIDVDEDKIYEEDGFYWANGCVTKIHANNRYLDYTLLAYTKAASGELSYATLSLNGASVSTADAGYDLGNVRGSLMDILSQAVVGDYTEEVLNCSAYNTWFGSEAYPIQVNNLATYNNLVNKVNDGVDFSDYTINVSDTVPTDGRVEVAEGKTLETQTSYIVKFCNDDNTLYKKYIVEAGESVAAPKNPAKASTAQYRYTFLGWDSNGDGVADDVVANATGSVTYKAVYEAVVNQYTITFDAEGGVAVDPVTVAYGTSLSTFCTQKYATADSGFYFDSWLYNDEKIDPNGIVESDMLLTAYYKRVDGLSVDEAPETAVNVSGAFYEAFLEIPVEEEVGTLVCVTMDIFVTGKIVSSGVDSTSEYYNQYATSSIKWVDSVWSDNGEVNASPVVVSFDRMQESQGEWMTISFLAEVRNFSALRDGTGWSGVEMSGENAVYLFAYKFKSAASFNYRNITVSTEEADLGNVVSDGTEKTSNANGYYQAFTGISTDLAVGTPVTVEMDIYVTGKYDGNTSINWVDTVWSVGGGEVNANGLVVNSTTMSANEGQWIHVTFDATVRNFGVLSMNSAYPAINVSEYGNAVYLMARNFKSAASFTYKNVSIVNRMPDGTQKTVNVNAHRQAFAGISTDFAVGTPVTVEMDVYVTGTYNQYTGGIKWVDTVYTTAGGEVDKAVSILDHNAMSANEGKWIHVTFDATVRNFSVLRTGVEYATQDTSAYGNAVYLYAEGFTSAASFSYKNVSIVGRMPDGTQKTANANAHRQAFAGLPTDLAVGTMVEVSMDVYVTGTYNQYTGGIKWVDTVYTTAGGEVDKAVSILDHNAMSANEGKWIHVTFDATVRNFSVLRTGVEYATQDTSIYGNAVYLYAEGFTSASSFVFKNVEMKEVASVPDGTKKSNGYYQAFVGLSTDYAVGTTVTVTMEVYVTGTIDSASSIRWVDTVWSDNSANNAPTIVDNATLTGNAGKWITVTFDATVRSFTQLRLDSQFGLMDVSSYGNAVYLMARNFKSAASFAYKNVKISLPGETEEPEVPETPVEPVIDYDSVPEGTYKTGATSGYTQAFVGLSTDLPAGTFVKVDMEIYVTGSYDEWTGGIKWVNTLHDDGAVNNAPQILSYEKMNEGAGQWITVSFYAYVRDFDELHLNSQYSVVNVSGYGKAVFLAVDSFTSLQTFNYKNVTITDKIKVVGEDTPDGTYKTGATSGYGQAFVGLETDLPEGTFVSVEMEIYVTGTYDTYAAITWVDTVWSTAGGESNNTPTIVSNATISANAGQWITVKFDATVRNFGVLRLNSGYDTMDMSQYGNAVYIMAKNFTSKDTFRYRNVTITEHTAMPDGVKKSNGFYQSFIGLPVEAEVGTTVTVSMNIYVTGTVDTQYSASNIKWVDTIYSNNGLANAPTIVDNATLRTIGGQWYHVEFTATVRSFSLLRGDANFSDIDVSSYGNAVYLAAYQFLSVESFYYKDVEITLNGENVYADREYVPATYTSNGEEIANYTIVYADNANKATQYAATILQARLRQVIGVDVAVATDATAETELEILLGDTNRSASAGIDYAALGEESYRVLTVDNDLVIAGNDRGVLYGVYAYLEALGYRFYTTDVEKIPSQVFVPTSMDLSWDPTFEYREVMYEMTWDADWAVSQRINSDFMRGELKSDSRYGGFEGYVGGGAWMVHTLYLLLPESELSTHSEYFSYVNGKRTAKDSKGLYTQPCLTSEGGYQYILNSALEKIASDRKANIISISENDSDTYCHCGTCEAEYAKYGGGAKGASTVYFNFINRIAGDIAKVYPDVYVDTLSYSMTKEVPAIDKLADNVIVRVCARMCNFCTDPTTCDQLAQQQARVQAFTEICDNVYVWTYPINWGNLFVAMPNYEEMRYQVQFLASVGVKGIYAEGYSKENPEFGELKAYLMAKLLQNPNMSESEYEYHYNDFLQGYYGDADTYIKQYHKLTKKMMNETGDGHFDLEGNTYYTPANNFDFTWDSSTKSYDMTNIDKINAMWENALHEVEEGSAQWHHVKKSMIHWTYIELYNTMDNRYANSNTSAKAKLRLKNKNLYEDILYYGTIRVYDNSHDIKEVTDFSKSPNISSGDWFDQKSIGDILGDIFGGLFG